MPESNLPPSRYQVIAFDADDTLWNNEPLYTRGKEKFQGIFSKQPGAGSRLDEIEEHNVSWYGYGIKSFTLSMLETAAEISTGAVPVEDLQAIFKISRDMLAAPMELFDGVGETLAVLSQKYDLMLVTKGDRFEQEYRFRRSGLVGLFKHIEILGNKRPDDYRELITRHGIAPQKFLMVGNSLRSDILPVIAIGGQAIYIPYENTWAHEHVSEDELKGVRYVQVDQFKLLLDILME